MRDQALFFGKTFAAKDLESGYSRERLIRTEIAVLSGLWAQSERDLSMPEPGTIQAYIERAYALLEEIHAAMIAPITASMRAMFDGTSSVEPLTEGAFMREAIFYAPISAYFFQFLDFAPLRYAQDTDWLREHRGFSPDEAHLIARAIGAVINAQLKHALNAMAKAPNRPASFLTALRITPAQVAVQASVDARVAEAVIDALSMKTRNANFNAVDDYNETNAFPLVPADDGSYFVFDAVAVSQSLYESPIFWMREDQTYAETARKHRGDFTETFARDCLIRCFGATRVFTNVSLRKGNKKVGEIDVLVLFGDRWILLQAKSKGLTIPARKGNDLRIQEDFKAAVDLAYRQALDCAQHLVAQDVYLALSDGTELRLRAQAREIFPVCLVADHFPSLSTQARTFLKPTVTEIIRSPFVMDIFLLDAMTEMLDTPLRLLGYMHQHAKVVDRVTVLHELTCLSYHLQKNLHLGSENDVVYFEDSISAELDAAMMVRRLGLPGDRTPHGILTIFAGTPFDRLVGQLEHSESPAAVDLGLLLLQMSSDTVRSVNEAIRRLCKTTLLQGGRHDCSLILGEGGPGLTLHVSNANDSDAQESLLFHSNLKKHQQKSGEWFAVLLDDSGDLRFAAVNHTAWTPSKEMDAGVAAILPPVARTASVAAAMAANKPTRKVAVNDLCPCGSGKKYKKCHLWLS